MSHLNIAFDRFDRHCNALHFGDKRTNNQLTLFL